MIVVVTTTATAPLAAAAGAHCARLVRAARGVLLSQAQGGGNAKHRGHELLFRLHENSSGDDVQRMRKGQDKRFRKKRERSK